MKIAPTCDDIISFGFSIEETISNPWNKVDWFMAEGVGSLRFSSSLFNSTPPGFYSLM